MKVEFITRQDCPLCDEAAAMLAKVRRRFRLDVSEIDVDTDPGLLELYGDSVPVARSADGSVLAAGRWSERELVAALRAQR